MRPTTTAPQGRQSRGPTIAYAVAWLVAAAAAVGIVFALSGNDGADKVSVPPLRETELNHAAGNNRCQLRARALEPLNPSVDGPPAPRPAKPGFYEQPLPTAELIAAMRRGVVVIQFRPGLDDKQVDELKTLQEAVPEGTIVVPNATGMPFELAVTAYRRLLGCPRFTERSLDAVQLFRGRFLGSGPDSS